MAQQHGVPLLPGSDVIANASDAALAADSIGYPVMLKSTAGGGGIGMQLCNDRAALIKAWDSVSNLSARNFANADLFLEKFVPHARHIEVQIFGDGKGGAIAIGERDCSAQRRNQKVLEEAPAPNLSQAVREQLHNVAVGLACAVDYRSAGTIEFIVDAVSEDFYFLEVNTRLQVEHGVTEEVYGIDIVRWMIELPLGSMPPLAKLEKSLTPQGHAIQARVYAEDPARNFQPCAGLLSHVQLPEEAETRRLDHWIEAGIEISPYFDPMLAKVIAKGSDRDAALDELGKMLAEFEIYGVETNIDYLSALLTHKPVADGRCETATLSAFFYSPSSIEVISPGTLSTVQDCPGRTGYWSVGIPPSGPFDSLSFRLGNRLLGNDENAAGLEMTLAGAQLRFTASTRIVLSGANAEASIDGRAIPLWSVCQIEPGETLHVGKIGPHGMRTYLLVAGGLQCPDYLGSRATFTLGKFGGHAGRALRSGDILHLVKKQHGEANVKPGTSLKTTARPSLSNAYQLRVIPGPQGAPEYFSQAYIDTFFSVEWEVHFNSSRTGVRLIGPKPEWTRSDGGEAGLHPSNIHDNAYAIGAIDFTGDMPVILGPDGPSLGGFVCAATVISADLWKIGQLAAGNKVQFVPVDSQSAVAQLRANSKAIAALEKLSPQTKPAASLPELVSFNTPTGTQVTIRPCGDSNLLVEYGQHVLDIELRFLVHRLMLALQEKPVKGLLDLTPGIRSLQVHYDCLRITRSELIDLIEALANEIAHYPESAVESRIVHLPLSWDDEQCRMAIEKYQQVVRKNAPWYPSNIEFIRRINGLESIEAVKDIIFSANYLVMGLGDVYLGAPVATPIDPRHRLVTTKYNPARTWTAENSVGIGGSYLCIYGMEGPGGYQFIGRTLQMWNRYRKSGAFSKPWLLRFFDQIRFYPVSADELLQIRKDFPIGNYPIKIEKTRFDLAAYKKFLKTNAASIDEFVERRNHAFNAELDRWKKSGEFHFEQETPELQPEPDEVPAGMVSIDSPATGSIWQVNVVEGDRTEPGQCL
ncbi:MAG: urea carboxylase, partial [Pseudomonadales bacterium]